MRNIDKLADAYAEGKSSSDVFRRAHRDDFLEGYDAAIKDLKQITQQLQEEDITSTVYLLKEVVKRMKNE
jgi:hypothetical protein